MRQTGAVVVALVIALASCGDDPMSAAPEIEIPSWAKVAPEQIAEAKKHGVPVAFENDLGMRFVLIPAGTFLMGSPEDEEGRNDDETQHEVTISKPFYMSIHEVTNAQFLRYQPSYEPASYDLRHTARMPHAGPEPACVAWQHVQGFADWLGTERRTFRIATEEEWEYACRAGTLTRFWWGESESEAGRYANVWDMGHDDLWDENMKGLPVPDGWGPFDTEDSHSRVAPVGSCPANRWGLHDMAGNAAEWCRWSDAIQPSAPARTAWPLVVRGGSCRDNRAAVRSAYRGSGPWDETSPPSFGFRLVSPLPGPEKR